MENEEMMEMSKMLDEMVKKDTVIVNALYFGRLTEDGIPAKVTTIENGIIVNEEDGFLPVELIRGILETMADEDRSKEIGLDVFYEANGVTPLYEEE